MLTLNNPIINRIAGLILTLFLCIIPAIPVLAFDIPDPTASFYTNDTADLISKENEDYIIATNEELYDKTGAQVVVVTIQSLNGISIEEYSNELFRKYGIGDANKNNGLLFLLALDDRECRIEVGYGLEGVINDAKAGRIMDKFMIPYFKDGKWDEGILNGFDYVLDELCQEYEIEIEHNEVRVPSRSNISEESQDGFASWGIIVAAIFALIGGMFIGYIFPNHALIPGALFLVVDFVILIAIFTPWNAVFAILLSIIAYLFGWAITSPDLDGGYSSGSYGGYSSSSGSSSSSHSSSSSSRNYGGGGRSGGGGASRKF